MEVRKRDKTVEKFDFSKIENAVRSAFTDNGCETPESVLKCLRDRYDETLDKIVDVEEIQDSVEDCLMDINPKIAKAYIIYRYEHKIIRENKDKLFREISKKLKAEDVQNQNANVDEYSFGGRLGEVTRIVTKDYALKNCMTRKARRNHENNEIYIHDLDNYAVGTHNCLTIPFDHLLRDGFNVRQTDVRPANSVDTAMQLVAVIMQLQSLQQFGRLKPAC